MDPVRFAWKWGGHIGMLTTVTWALWRGEKPGRYAAVILAVSWALTIVFHKQGVYTPELGVVLVDCATLAGFVWVSLWSRRLWTVFLSAFQLDCVASHFAAMMAPHIGGFSYLTASGLWGGYGLILALGVGMSSLEKRRKVEDRPAAMA